MERIQQLKEQLQALRDKDWKMPEGLELYPLAMEAMSNIGTTDPVLRDELILEFLFVLITERLLSKEQIKELLSSCLSEKHLFYKLGEKEDDSIFNRAFTILIVRAILYYHRNFGEDLLNKEEIQKVFDDALRFVRQEKDLRGYVKDKGWAHAMAHSGDALRALALCNELSPDQLLEILEVIREKVSIYNYVYINEEAERLTSVVINIIHRNVIREEKIVNWIRSFGNLEVPSSLPERHYWKENIKNFLRSMYFRLKFKKESEAYLQAIEETQNKLNEFFNNLKA
ncbi:MAG: hypothetical protein K0R84_88 [Clostridia bacterium]|jgi:hypothetical protein|nr:hypothetical protein [Clostridia bacterium]